jgi:hypothetical protein
VSTGRRRGKGKDSDGVKMEVCYIYTYEDRIMKPTKHCLKTRSGGGNGNIMQRVNLFKVYCMELSQ